MKYSFPKFITLIIFLQFSIASTVFSDIPIMPLNQVKPGMRAICKTVFQGTTVEEFELEIVEIIKNFSPRKDLLLVRLLSPKTQQTGVVSGMSGSPVYIDNKLVGALAIRFGVFTKEPIGGVTPIEQMLEIFQREDYRDRERTALGASNHLPTEFVLAIPTDVESREKEFVHLLTRNFQPARSAPGGISNQFPISVAGFMPQTVEKFTRLFSELGFTMIQGGGEGASGSPIQMVPGGAVSGILVDGDVSIAANGTITYVSGNKILAFGHPFFGSGAVNIPMAPAKILMTISSTYSSYKMAQTGKINGALHQDRTAGIMGVIGDTAPMIPVRLAYHSPFGEMKQYNYRFASDKSLNSSFPFFLWMTLSNSITTARTGSGDFSTTLEGKISIADHDDIVINNFYSGSQSGQDAALSTLEVAIFTANLLGNSFLNPKIESIDLTFRSTLGKKVAKIERVWYDKSQLIPGESVNLNIFIRPYQQDLIKISQELKLPENLEPGFYSLFVGSPGFISKVEKSISPGRFIPHNFSHLIKLLNQKKKNNVLITQLRKPEKGTAIGDQEFTSLPPSKLLVMNSKKTSNKKNRFKDVLLIEQQQTTDWVLTGGQWIRIRVVKEK